MAAQIHIAGSTWIRVSRQLVNRSLTPAKSITKAPTINASGASQRRERLSRRMTSSAAATSLSLTAWTNRSICARRVDRRDRGSSPWPAAGKPWAGAARLLGCIPLDRHYGMPSTRPRPLRDKHLQLIHRLTQSG